MIRAIIAILVAVILLEAGVILYQANTIKKQQQSYIGIRTEFNEILREINQGRN